VLGLLGEKEYLIKEHGEDTYHIDEVRDVTVLLTEWAVLLP